MPAKPPVGCVGIGSSEPWLMPWMKATWRRFWHGSDADPFDLVTMQANRQLQFIGDMQRLELKPGDAIVLQCSTHLTEAMAKNIRTAMEGKFPGHTVLVLDQNMRIGVLGKRD